MSLDVGLDEALWSLLQGEGRDAVGHLESIPADTHWMDKVVRYLVQRCLMGDLQGAAGVFGSAETASMVVDGGTVMGSVLRGLIARFEGDYDTAVQELVKAVEQDAGDPWAGGCLGLLLAEAGVVDDAFLLMTHLRSGDEQHPFVERVNGLVEAASKAGPPPRA